MSEHLLDQDSPMVSPRPSLDLLHDTPSTPEESDEEPNEDEQEENNDVQDHGDASSEVSFDSGVIHAVQHLMEAYDIHNIVPREFKTPLQQQPEHVPVPPGNLQHPLQEKTEQLTQEELKNVEQARHQYLQQQLLTLPTEIFYDALIDNNRPP